MLGTFYNDYWFSRPRPATRGDRLRCQVGPNLGATVILHDIAHAIEFGADNFAKRYRNGSFYFKTPRARYIGDTDAFHGDNAR